VFGTKLFNFFIDDKNLSHSMSKLEVALFDIVVIFVAVSRAS
jgi:hypothetical protein